MDRIIEVEREGKVIQLVGDKPIKFKYKYFIELGKVGENLSRIGISEWHSRSKNEATKYFYSVLDDLFKLEINAKNN